MLDTTNLFFMIHITGQYGEADGSRFGVADRDHRHCGVDHSSGKIFIKHIHIMLDFIGLVFEI